MADEVFHYPQGAVDAFTRQLNDDIAGAIKFLLEEKHLYQKVTVDPDAIAAKMMLRVHEKDRQWTSEHIHGTRRGGKCGAGRGSRTPKTRRSADFESAASASSAIPAWMVKG
jgi:hypothetical protein